VKPPFTPSPSNPPVTPSQAPPLEGSKAAGAPFGH
jgi:hypothetical protein